MKALRKSMSLLSVLLLAIAFTAPMEVQAKGWGIGKHIKATFGNKKAKKEIAQKRASKYKKKAEKSCAKGKARACERHKRKAAGNEAMAKTGKNSTKRQVKRSLRQTRRGEKACSKGKQRKCDRLTRKAAFNNCKATGNNKKDCRKAKRSLREDQKAYRKGLSDENVTAGVRQQNLANRDARYGALGIGAGAVAAKGFVGDQAEGAGMNEMCTEYGLSAFQCPAFTKCMQQMMNADVCLSQISMGGGGAPPMPMGNIPPPQYDRMENRAHSFGGAHAIATRSLGANRPRFIAPQAKVRVLGRRGRKTYATRAVGVSNRRGQIGGIQQRRMNSRQSASSKVQSGYSNGTRFYDGSKDRQPASR